MRLVLLGAPVSGKSAKVLCSPSTSVSRTCRAVLCCVARLPPRRHWVGGLRAMSQAESSCSMIWYWPSWSAHSTRALARRATSSTGSLAR